MIQSPSNPKRPIERAAVAIIEAGYDLSRLDVEAGSLLLAVAEDGAESILKEIQGLAAPLGCVADWTGNSNTGDGYTEVDIAVEEV